MSHSRIGKNSQDGRPKTEDQQRRLKTEDWRLDVCDSLVAGKKKEGTRAGFNFGFSLLTSDDGRLRAAAR